MGQQIALQCALYGNRVFLYDIKEEMIDTAFERMRIIGKVLVKKNKFSEADITAAMECIDGTTDKGAAAEEADLLIENVPENPDLKKKVFSEFHELCPEKTIFATNTSSLVPSMLADGTGRPEKFAAFHFHDIQITDVVDIMPHPGTSPETVTWIQEFAVDIGQVPIMLKKENNGYVFNYMLMALFKSAQTLASKGVASVEDIDRAWMGVTGMEIGPFGLMDGIGVDTVWMIAQYWASVREDKAARKNAEFLKEYVDAGKVGKKAGEGFYAYPKPEYRSPEFLGKK